MPKSTRKRSLKPVANVCTRANDWKESRRILSEYLHIGELNSSSNASISTSDVFLYSADDESRISFEKVHERYSHVVPTMRKVYKENRKNDVVTAGVIGLVGDLFADATLRERLYEDGMS